VNSADAPVTASTASTRARFSAIFSTVFQVSGRSGFSTSPTSCPVMTGSSSRNFAPHPFFFLKQTQPPPYSCLPLMMAATPHAGHVRSCLRLPYFFSRVVHRPSP
jgi:hypothetical protein